MTVCGRCLPLFRFRNVPLIGKGEKFIGMNGHPPQFFIVTRIIGQCPQKRIRILIREKLMQFTVYGSSFFMVKGQLAFDRDIVNSCV